MREIDLRGIDLNLLVVLDALLEERHVTRTAQRLGLSQPATSSALKRLRRLLGDPLLMREGNHFELTERAIQTQEPLRKALESLQAAISKSDPFDASQYHGFVRLAATDHVMLVLLPPLEHALSEEAPGMELEVHPLTHLDPPALARSDELDLAIGTFGRRLSTRLRRLHLFDEQMSCLLRSGHPALTTAEGENLPIDQFLAYPHLKVTMTPEDPGAVDAALAKIGRERHVACQLPSFLAAPFIIQKTDFIVAMPSRVVDTFARLLELQSRMPPVNLRFATEMVWHVRLDDSPSHIWFRDKVAQVASDLSPS